VLGDVGEAIRIFESWLKEEPDDPIARHMLAACNGRDLPARASDGYVERTFDGFAASFESKLQKLSYRAPALVAEALEQSGLAASKRLDVLDAGCGTDTLVYFGDLEGVVAAAAGALRPNGLFVFTLEHAAGADPDAGYRLELHGRYSHRRAYVGRLLVGAGLQPEIAEADLRMESGAPVAGLVVRGTK
jgi:predicted TPR repeat methyltransferase